MIALAVVTEVSPVYLVGFFLTSVMLLCVLAVVAADAGRESGVVR